MLLLVFRKIISNTWKVLCLLLGSILVVGMICSMPIYSNGILQRMLTKDLENVQSKNSRYPGYIAFNNYYGYFATGSLKQYIVDMRAEYSQLISKMPVDPLVTLETIQIPNLYFTANVDSRSVKQSFSLAGMTDFVSHISIVKGRMSKNAPENGVIEAVVTEAALQNLNLLFDHEYDIYSFRQNKDQPSLLTIKIVGIFTAADSQDVYWYKHINLLTGAVLVDSTMLEQLTVDNPVLVIGEHQQIAAYDYHQFRIQDIKLLQSILDEGKTISEDHKSTTQFISTFSTVIDQYVIREAELKLTLQILIIPVLLMLIFYVFMVSQLMVRSETGVISVLESRGAKRSQILVIYGAESLVYAFITIILGPLLGLWMVKIIGASNGFLEFVNRKALHVEIDGQAIIYALAAIFLFLATILIPVFAQSNTTIVEQKRKKSRSTNPPFWQKIFLDILLLAASLYALYRLNAQRVLQMVTGLAGIEADLDFLLYLSSTLFILGAGLLFLRLYPWLVRLVYFLGRRFWNPVLYASFHQILRSGGREQFLMLFLILALSIGLFNANAARTINRNSEDAIRCKTGADINLQEFWQKYDKNGVPIVELDALTTSLEIDPSAPSGAIKYDEPNFKRYKQLAGVESAARVYRSDKSQIVRGITRSGTINLMAIDPYDFAQTAWTRSDLYKYNMNEYMNVMINMPNAVILSRNLKEELDLEVGDGIVYTVNGSDSVSGVIIAFVDYWPGYLPVTTNSNNGELRKERLLVANLEFMLSKTAIAPYEVWLKRSAGTTDKVIYDDIEAKNINVTSITSATQQIVIAKNDPKLQGTNGALTLGFIVSMLICAAGFLIYWVMSVQGRVLQFGIFRAMGMSKFAVIGMLISEQVLVSAVAVLAGVLVGNLGSILFVPLFQLVYSSADQPIPFRIISEQSDSTKIFLVLGVLLLICFAALTRLILRIKIDQAVKLGEE